ncbi:MAG: hypothetical protein FWH33_04310, partial [Oscillospiraceae bacterium]|nr:hypothetical protein [Oscillospiraceae bacterium]
IFASLVVIADCVSFASAQVRKLTHFVALPLPKKPYGFSGTPCKEAERCETEARMPHLSTNEAKKTSAERKGVKSSDCSFNFCQAKQL